MLERERIQRMKQPVHEIEVENEKTMMSIVLKRERERKRTVKRGPSVDFDVKDNISLKGIQE